LPRITTSRPGSSSSSSSNSNNSNKNGNKKAQVPPVPEVDNVKRQKHNEIETRRRMRMKNQFDELGWLLSPFVLKRLLLCTRKY
jgi:hypothetical protein